MKCEHIVNQHGLGSGGQSFPFNWTNSRPHYLFSFRKSYKITKKTFSWNDHKMNTQRIIVLCANFLALIKALNPKL